MRKSLIASLLASVLLLILAQWMFTAMRPSLIRPLVYFLGSAAALFLLASLSAFESRAVR